MRILVLVLGLIANTTFGQNQNIENIDNVFLKNSKKSKIKIEKKAPITFISIEKRDSIYIQKNITGYIRSLNDTISCQILPIDKVTRIYINNKLIQDYKDFREESFLKLENIEFDEFNKISYQKVKNRKINLFLNKLSLYTLIATLSTIPFIKSEFDDKGINKEIPVLGLYTASLTQFLVFVFKPDIYYLRPCKDCKGEKQVFHFKVM